MSEIPEPAFGAVPPPVEEDDAGETLDTSTLSRLRATRSRIGKGAEPLDVDVPGYDGQLVLRFVWTDLDQMAKTGPEIAKIKDPAQRTTAASADAIASACTEVLVRVEETDKAGIAHKVVKPLSTNGVPVTFGDKRLAFALGFDAPNNQRDMVIRTFNNTYALIDVAGELAEWLSDTTKSVNDQTLGE